MRVCIDSDIICNITDDDYGVLKYLMYICSYHNRYTLCIDGNLPDGCERHLTQSEKDLFKCASINAINNSQYDCTISRQGGNYVEEPIFTLDESIRYLIQPVSIVLENNKNDALFIDALIRSYNKRELIEAKKEHWFCYMNAGGCSNVCNLIEAMLAQFDNKRKFLRCYVILDSDKLAPAHINPKNKKTELYLTQHCIPYHIWEKRMMENYMPDDAMPDGPWKKAYVFLSEDQKDYYNLAHGFEKDEKFIPRDDKMYSRTSLLKEQWDFYSDLTEGNYRILHKGVGLKQFKEEFPKFFSDTTKVYYEVLQQRTAHQKNPDELKDLLDEIVTLL